MSRNRKLKLAAWDEARRACGLTARQVEMAKQLGLNPRKLPGLRPAKSQPWKAPVGNFIERLHAKRFGGPSEMDWLIAEHGNVPPESLGRTREGLPPAAQDLPPPAEGDDPVPVLFHLQALLDDFIRAMEDGPLRPHSLPDFAADLRRVAQEIEAGLPVSPLPYACAEIDDFDDVPDRRSGAYDDHDVPF